MAIILQGMPKTSKSRQFIFKIKNMKKIEKISLQKMVSENKAITREDLIKLKGGYSYTYTGCSATSANTSDCSGGHYD
jgi:natural product precursor